MVDLDVRPELQEEHRVEERGEGAAPRAQVLAPQVDDGDRHEEEAGDVDDVQQEPDALPDPFLNRKATEVRTG